MKKKIFMATLPILLLAACTTEPSYKINGIINLDNTDGQYVYLRHHNQKVNIDSALITGNTFSFEGKSDSVELYDLYINKDKKYPIPFVLENATMQAKINNTSFDCVTGTIENDALTKLKEEIDLVSKDYDKYIADYKSEDPEKRAAAEEKLSAMFEKREALQTQFIVNNTDKLVAGMIFSQNYYSMNDEDLFAIADKANSKFLSYPGMNKILKIVNKRKQVAVGKKFIDFEMPNMKGENKKLSDFVGKGEIVLIDFWATWCGPCRASMPELIKTYNKYKSKGFNIIGISLDQKKENWENGIKDLKLPWNHLSDLQGWKCKGASLYGVNSIPHTILVNKEGTIVAKNLHGEELNKKIEELFK